MNSKNQRGRGMRHLPTALVLAVVLVVGGCTKSPEQLIASANESIAAKDHPTAIVTLKNLLQVEPDNIEGRLLLAESSLAMGDPLSAEKELEKAAELGEQGPRFLALHYRTQLTLGRNTKVLELLAIDEGTKGLSKNEELQFRGEALLGLGSSLEAARSFEQILESGEDPYALWGLAASKAAQGATDEVAEIGAHLADNYPDFARGWLIKGRMALRTGQLENAVRNLQVAADKAAATPNRLVEIVALSALGDAQLGLRNVDDAEVTIRRLASYTGPTPVTSLLAARLAMAQGNLTEASGELDRILSTNPNNLQASLLLASVHVQQKNFAQARALLERVMALFPDNLAARRLLAAAQVEMDDPEAAAATLAPALELDDGGPQLSILSSQVMIQAGDPQRAVELLEASLANDPQNNDIKLRLAASYLSVDRAADAHAMAESVPADASFQRGVVLAFALAALDRLSEADAAMSEVLATSGDQTAVKLVAASYYERRGDNVTGKDLLRRAVDEAPNDVSALYALARAERLDGESMAAKSLYERVIAQDAGHVRSLSALADYEARDGNLGRSLELLNQAVAAQPDAETPRLMLAQAQLRAGDSVSAERSAHRAVELAPDNAAILGSAANVLLDVGKAREAQVYLSDAVELAPDVSAYWFALARAQSALGESLESRRALEEAVRLNPGSLRASSALAWAELRDGNEDTALAIVERLKTASPDSVAPLVLEADILARLGRSDDAAAVYASVFEQNPSGQVAINLYRAKLRAGSSEAEAVLEQWVSQAPDDDTATLILAQHYERDGERDKAVRYYDQAISSNPENAVALNNLAWIYHVQGDDRAEGLARRALEQMPDSPSVMDTLAWILVENGETAEGYELLERAAAANPDSRGIQYHLAVASNVLGNPSRSIQILETILADDTQFDDRAEAEALLEELR